MNTSPGDLIVYICVCVFAGTAIATFLGLFGIVKIGGSNQAKHDYYLKRLFHILVVEVVVTCVAYFGNVLNVDSKYRVIEPAPIPTKAPTLEPTQVPTPTINFGVIPSAVLGLPSPLPLVSSTVTPTPLILDGLLRPTFQPKSKHGVPMSSVNMLYFMGLEDEEPQFLLGDGRIVQYDESGTLQSVAHKTRESIISSDWTYQGLLKTYFVGYNGRISDGLTTVGYVEDIP